MSVVIRKGFINTGAGQVHYRMAGSGPPIILLHDSPRSSVLHVPLLEYFSDQFTVIAIDTPGYGNSTALPLEPRPEIIDFAGALAETIAGFGVQRCPVYGFHTSSKILLEFAANHPERVAIAIMDGLSLPPGDTDHAFIKSYMKAFNVTDTGSYLAEEWTRVRDFSRWFPWFAKSKATRMPIAQRNINYTHEYAMDLFMAGPNFSDAYSAAMRYKAHPVVPTLKARCVFTAREDDVLYGFLDSLPDQLPEGSTIERLKADRKAWLARLRELFVEHADFDGAADFTPPDPLDTPLAGNLITRSYVNTAMGQVLVRRTGDGSNNPVLFLHDLPGSARADETFLKGLGRGRTVFGVDLPGCCDSTPLSEPSAEGYTAQIIAILDELGIETVDLLANGMSTPLAAHLAVTHGRRIRKLVLDAVPLMTADVRKEMKINYLPDLRPQTDGTHLHRCWHMLRDQSVQWPWYDGSVAAIRNITPDIEPNSLYMRLVDTLKQWERAGDAISAAIDIDTKTILSELKNQTLVFETEDDVRYKDAGKVANKLSEGILTARPFDTVERAGKVLDFLGT
ncbi:MAG: alpha/beta fold hydrolase [Rhodospirillaceae bacterium]